MHIIGKILINEENGLVGSLEVATGSYNTIEEAISEMNILVSNESSDVNIIEFFYGTRSITGPNDSDYRIDVTSTVDKIL
jgi:hypothetical protein